jgi:hypothetical protein
MTDSDQELGSTAAFAAHHETEVEHTLSEAEETADASPRAWWMGHATPLWAVGTGYLILFIAYLGLAEFGHASAAFILHTLFALTFVLSCAANLFHTPSHGETYRAVHRWMGWKAVWSGFAVVLSGYGIVLSGKSRLSTTAQNIFLGTGAMQIVVQVALVYFIRYAKSVWYHMVSACVLFYATALMPAINRAPNIFHFQDSDTFTIVIMPFGAVFTYFAIRYYARQMKN